MSYVWKPEYEAELDLLVAAGMEDDKRLYGKIPKEMANAYRKLTRCSNDLLALACVYVEGFNDVLVGGGVAQKVSKEVSAWTKSVGERNAWTLSALVATTECAILERFIKDFATLHLTPGDVARVRSSFVGDRKLPADDAKAVKKLVKYIKPSAMSADTEWVSDFDTVLGCKLDPAVAGSLVSMIVFRNSFIHDAISDDLLHGTWATPIPGEQLKSWALSVILCSSAVLRTKYT